MGVYVLAKAHRAVCLSLATVKASAGHENSYILAIASSNYMSVIYFHSVAVLIARVMASPTSAIFASR